MLRATLLTTVPALPNALVLLLTLHFSMNVVNTRAVNNHDNVTRTMKQHSIGSQYATRHDTGAFKQQEAVRARTA